MGSSWDTVLYFLIWWYLQALTSYFTKLYILYCLLRFIIEKVPNQEAQLRCVIKDRRY